MNDALRPETIIFDGLSAQGLVQLVEELRERISDLEVELKAVRLLAEDASGTASDADHLTRELKDDLENGTLTI